MNFPAMFQMIMNMIFCKLINKGKVVICIDDIMIFTADIEEHHQIEKEVLEILWKINLFLKPSKCKFETKETEYLRLIVGHGTAKMDLVKVKAIAEWPASPIKQKRTPIIFGAFKFLSQIHRRF